MIEFPRYTGPPFLPSYPKVIPIVPVEKKDLIAFTVRERIYE